MRYLQLTVAPGEESVHPLFPVMTESSFVEHAQMLDWNAVRSDTTTVLFRIEGEPGPMADALAAEPVVIEFELTPATDGEFYAYVHTEAVETERRLWLAFTQERSMLVPPLDYGDGTVTCRIVGTAAELRRAFAEVPDGLETAVERVGEFDSPPAESRADLTDRQREVVEAAIGVGYYRVPRDATAADVARELDLDPSTVSEHLRKAEARLARAFVGG